MIFKNFVSLGPNCVIRSRLDFYLKNKEINYGETNFFDYNLCNSNSLVQLLKVCDIDYYFNLNNIEYKRTNDTHGFAHVWLKNVYFKSIHDVKNCEDNQEVEKEILRYIEKYKRRHDRLIKRIKNSNPLVLIYMGEIKDEEYDQIRINLNSISQKKIPIVCLHDFGENSYIEKKDLFVKINYNLYRIGVETKTNWIWMDFLDWNNLFFSMEKIYQDFFNKKLF